MLKLYTTRHTSIYNWDSWSQFPWRDYFHPTFPPLCISKLNVFYTIQVYRAKKSRYKVWGGSINILRPWAESSNLEPDFFWHLLLISFTFPTSHLLPILLTQSNHWSTLYLCSFAYLGHFMWMELYHIQSVIGLFQLAKCFQSMSIS